MRYPRLVAAARPSTIEDAVKASGFLAGRLEDIIEALKGGRGRDSGTPLEVQLADLDRFAKEVIPAFRDTRTATAAKWSRGPAAGTLLTARQRCQRRQSNYRVISLPVRKPMGSRITGENRI